MTFIHVYSLFYFLWCIRYLNFYFFPPDKSWWNVGDKNNPFSSGVLYIKQKVGACSYIDDPIGCQSLLSRVMHKVNSSFASIESSSGIIVDNTILSVQVFGSRGLSSRNLCNSGPSRPNYASVDQLIGTFSSDPSLIAFAQLCCDPSWDGRQVGYLVICWIS